MFDLFERTKLVCLTFIFATTAAILPQDPGRFARQTFPDFTEIILVDSIADSLDAAVSAWVDYDSDGDFDIFTVHRDSSNFLFDYSESSFSKVKGLSITSLVDVWSGCSWGDYDNDGDPDVFLTRVPQNMSNILYRNDGDGSFTDVSAIAGSFSEDMGPATSSSWADVDRDGYLDLFVTNRTVSSNTLYINNQDGSFRRVTEEENNPVVTDIGNSSSAFWGDYNDDGFVDLIVINSTFRAGADTIVQPNFLYRNNGSGNFVRVLSGPVAEDLFNSQGGSWVDFDSDGDLDLYVTNTTLSDDVPPEDNTLYRNDGDPDADGEINFVALGESDGIGTIASDSGTSFGVAWSDYDNDGDLDAYMSNADGEQNFVYENAGENFFFRIMSHPLISDTFSTKSASLADYDDDGDQDLYVTNDNDALSKLFRNENANGNYSLVVELQATHSNRSAFGASVLAHATVNGHPLVQRREITAASSILSQSAPQAHFGFGTTTVIDTLEIRWPSGGRQVLANVDISSTQKLVIIESAMLSDFEETSLNGIVQTFGAAWADIDNDGDDDLYLGNESGDGSGANNSLYLNDGNGNLQLTSEGSIDQDGSESRSVVFADYDGDGDADLYVCNFTGPNLMYNNNGQGNFTPLLDIPPVTGSRASMAATFADIDGDGDLDLFVANNQDENNQLFVNNGDGDLEEIFGEPLVSDGMPSTNAGFIDYDCDGDVDLFVTNRLQQNNLLYANDGSGKFTAVTANPVVTAETISTGFCWGDYDNDGYPDLLVTNNQIFPNELYHNDGGETFTQIDDGPIGSQTANSIGSTWGDFDNDGDLDLIVINSDRENFIYLNSGNGDFVAVASQSPISDLPGENQLVSVSDFNSDQRLDFILTNNDNENANYLFTNQGNIGQAMQFILRGTVSNHFGVGSRLILTSGSAEIPRRQYRETQSLTNSYSQNSREVHFGTGRSGVADSLIVVWPSGTRQAILAPSNGKSTITELWVDAHLDSSGFDRAWISGSVRLPASAVSVFLEYGPGISNLTRRQAIATAPDADSIASFSVEADSLEINSSYVFRSIASSGNSESVSPFYSFTTKPLPIPPAEYLLQYSASFPAHADPADFSTSDFRMIGIPGNGSDFNIQEFVSGEQGTDWQIYRDDGSEADNADWESYLQIHENTAFFRTNAGRAFLLIRKGDWTINQTVPTVPLDSSGFAGIEVHPGWNMIANPYNLPISWYDVQLVNDSLADEQIHEFNGNGYITANIMQPFVGYYFYYAGLSNGTIYFPYEALFVGSGSPADKSLDWRIAIYLEQALSTYQAGYLGVGPSAKSKLDRHDVRKPRALLEQSGISFHQRDSKGERIRLIADIRPQIDDIDIWEFDVTAIPGENTTLVFSGLEDLPAEFSVVLYQEAGAAVMDLADEIRFSFMPTSPLSRFKLAIGMPELVKDIFSDAVPSRFNLRQNYPNPFNPATSIALEVPRRVHGSLTVYNVLGERVRTIYTGTFTPGRHWFEWRGLDDSDRNAASGFYFYRFESADFTQVRKMLLVR